MCCSAVAATPRDGRCLTVSSEEAVRVPRRPAGAHCQPIVVITSLASQLIFQSILFSQLYPALPSLA